MVGFNLGGFFTVRGEAWRMGGAGLRLVLEGDGVSDFGFRISDFGF